MFAAVPQGLNERRRDHELCLQATLVAASESSEQVLNISCPETRVCVCVCVWE